MRGISEQSLGATLGVSPSLPLEDRFSEEGGQFRGTNKKGFASLQTLFCDSAKSYAVLLPNKPDSADDANLDKSTLPSGT